MVPPVQSPTFHKLFSLFFFFFEPDGTILFNATKTYKTLLHQIHLNLILYIFTL
ncbi:hypothetical protein HanXRQr2_Chr09g0409151 [Helianthus annuus]|uniref:Uncharacterized protein n=1 Tax=Helianthus annuus TaxID=4232 RepID=A0A9K3IAP0_HELAN|nr:hypothetical protein HanXRQr2_Chr09g0409151 [Helianthus annuus]